MVEKEHDSGEGSHQSGCSEDRTPGKKIIILLLIRKFKIDLMISIIFRSEDEYRLYCQRSNFKLKKKKIIFIMIFILYLQVQWPEL